MYEYVHRRSVTRGLVAKRISSNKSFEWLSQMRFYFDPRQADVLKQLSIHMADTQFHYGFEYLGVQERLVTTPVTDRCYLTMTQALASNLGGSPFGPAGTGKTETVKALGNQLGRFVRPFYLYLLYSSLTSTFLLYFTILYFSTFISTYSGLSSSSTATRPSTSRPWAGSSWVCARSGRGAASTSSTGSRRGCCLRCRSRSRPSRSAWHRAPAATREAAQ